MSSLQSFENALQENFESALQKNFENVFATKLWKRFTRKLWKCLYKRTLKVLYKRTLKMSSLQRFENVFTRELWKHFYKRNLKMSSLQSFEKENVKKNYRRSHIIVMLWLRYSIWALFRSFGNKVRISLRDDSKLFPPTRSKASLRFKLAGDGTLNEYVR